MSLNEHITGLFVAGLYYWFTDNELGAETCWKTGVELLPIISITNPKRMEWLQ